MRAKKSGRKLVLVMGLALALLLSACGELTPSGDVDGLLINEVFTNTAPGNLQWVELLVNANSKDEESTIDLRGVLLNSSKGSVDLGTLKGVGFLPALPGATGRPSKTTPVDPGTPVPAGTFIVIASSPSSFSAAYPNSKVVALDGSAVLGTLSPSDDALSLTRGNNVLDQLGWGNPSAETIGKLKTNSDINLKMPAPGTTDPPRTLGRTPSSDPVRNPAKPGIWSIHDTASPGGIVARPADKYNFVLNEFTNIISVVGGLLLYLVFVMIAVVARRFETLAQQRTFWQLLLAAPFGIFIYSVVTIIAFVTVGSYNDFYRIIGFIPLFLSGLACMAVINVFRNIAKDILAAD